MGERPDTLPCEIEPGDLPEPKEPLWRQIKRAFRTLLNDIIGRGDTVWIVAIHGFDYARPDVLGVATTKRRAEALAAEARREQGTMHPWNQVKVFGPFYLDELTPGGETNERP